MASPVQRPGRHRDSAGVRARRRIAVLVTASALLSAGIGVARAVAESSESSDQSVAAPATPTAGATNVGSTGAGASGTSAKSSTAGVPGIGVPAPSLPGPSTSGGSPEGASPSRTTAVPVPERGAGTTTPVRATGADTTGSGKAVTYTIEVEQQTGIDPQEAANTIAGVLRDRRGWQSVDGIRFVQLTAAQRADGTRPQVRIVLASPATTDRLCAPLSTEGKLSCGTDGRAVLNLRPWLNGTPWYGGPAGVATYRNYLVNHEVGHLIGHPHVSCPGADKPAPVMVQQTKGLQGCSPNPWPTRTRG